MRRIKSKPKERPGTIRAQTSKIGDAAQNVITDQVDRRFAAMAVSEAAKSIPEDSRPHPKVGAVVVKDGKVLAVAHRGEVEGCHAEYIALEEKLRNVTVAGATVYTTLEPCTQRNDPKVACAYRLKERRVSRVVMGILDPNPAVEGYEVLRDAGIEVQFFPSDLMNQIDELNRDFIRAQRKKTIQVGPKTTKWEPNIAQLTYLNIPRISQVAALEGLRLAVDGLPNYEFLDDLGLELNRVLVSVSESINKLQIQAVSSEQLPDNKSALIGKTISFAGIFRTKNGPKLFKARRKKQTITFSGDLEKDPHIYMQYGSSKLVMMIDPKWITSKTAFLQFASGRQAFAGLCVVTRVRKGLVIASPIIVGTPRSLFDSAASDEEILRTRFYTGQKQLNARDCLENVLGASPEFKLVYSELTMSASLTKLIKVSKPWKKWSEQERKNRLTHFLSPTDREFKTGTIQFRGTKVACVCEVRGAGYLASLLSKAGQSNIEIVTANSAQIRNSLFAQNFIAIGAKSNQMTEQLLSDKNNCLLQIDVSNISDVCFRSLGGKRLTPLRKKGVDDYGAIIRIRPEAHPDRTWIACAGLGEHGTSGAAWFLANRFARIAEKLTNNSGISFVCIVKVKDVEDADSSATLFQFSSSEKEWIDY